MLLINIKPLKKKRRQVRLAAKYPTSRHKYKDKTVCHCKKANCGNRKCTCRKEKNTCTDECGCPPSCSNRGKILYSATPSLLPWPE